MKASNMPANPSELPVDLKHPNRVLLSGLFRETTQVNKTPRDFLTYIPEALEYCSPCLVTALPSGTTAETYLESSGLKQFAEQNRIFLHLLYPQETMWNHNELDADYVNAVYVTIQARDYYITQQDNIYACGIGDAADIVHMAAKKMASEWSGIITIGDLTVDVTVFSNSSHGEEEQGQLELKIQGSKAQLPVWMQISHNQTFNQKAVDYWKEQNHVTEQPLQGNGADYIWSPTPVRIHQEINEEYIAQVRLRIAEEPFSVNTLDIAWKYISMARRHRGQGQKCLRYYKDPSALGAVRKTMEIDGMVRTWYEYRPSACTDDKKWPLVVVMHGRGGSAETFFDMSGMSLVAEARHFIAVFPESGIHQQKKNGLKNVLLWCGSYEGNPIDDMKFIRLMVNDIEQRHPIDHGRIYACGQSSGGMMSDMLSYGASDLFAAVAPWSALRSPSRMSITYPETPGLTPTMLLFGNHDFVCAGKEYDPVLHLALDPEIHGIVMEKIQKYRLDPKNIQIWDTYPISWRSFPNSQGIPMLVIGIIDNMVHANYPEESWISYDQFLSKFSRNENGILCYCQNVVEDDICSQTNNYKEK